MLNVLAVVGGLFITYIIVIKINGLFSMREQVTRHEKWLTDLSQRMTQLKKDMKDA